MFEIYKCTNYGIMYCIEPKSSDAKQHLILGNTVTTDCKSGVEPKSSDAKPHLILGNTVTTDCKSGVEPKPSDYMLPGSIL